MDIDKAEQTACRALTAYFGLSMQGKFVALRKLSTPRIRDPVTAPHEHLLARRQVPRNIKARKTTLALQANLLG
jgi:hypothetical protein